jgi:acetylornithine aminotransferase/acetylornithine/N-succinyldiaminopimelate aminotransferase
MGLMQGLVLTDAGIACGAEMVQSMFAKHILINFAGNKVLRFLPPLIISNDEIDLLIAGLDTTLTEMR